MYQMRDEEAAAFAAMKLPTGKVRAALLEGSPGCGKTAFSEFVAKELGGEYVYGLLHSWSDDQELFCGVDIAAAIEGDHERVRQPGLLAVAAEKSQAGTTVLCLDEVDKVQERTEYLLLDFLQTGRVPLRPGVHVQAKLDNLLVFLTSNASRPLSDAMLRRVRRVRMKPMLLSTMVELAVAQTKIPKGIVTIAAKLAKQVSEADKAVLTLQELVAFVRDASTVAATAGQCREFLAQWAARAEVGAHQAMHEVDVNPLWAEISKSRRTYKSRG